MLMEQQRIDFIPPPQKPGLRQVFRIISLPLPKANLRGLVRLPFSSWRHLLRQRLSPPSPPA